MDYHKIRFLEESLAQKDAALKKAQEDIKKISLDLDYKTEELETTRQNLSSIVNKKQLEINSLFKSIIDPYILMDLFGNVIKMNKASIDFFGANNNIESFNVMDTLFHDDYEYAMKSFYQLIEKGTFRNFRTRIYDKHKNLKWVDINCNIVYDHKGNPTLAQGIIRDITKQKLQQDIFDEQKKQLDAIVEHSSIGIVLTQEDKIIKSNKAIQKLLGYTEEELTTLSMSSIIEKKEIDNEEVSNTSTNKCYRSKSGKTIWAKTNTSVIKTTHKNNYQVALIDDITEELQNQSLLLGLNSLMSSILGKTNIHEIAWEITATSAKLLGFEDCVIYLLNYKTGKLEQIAAFENKIDANNIITNQLEISIGEGIVGSVAKEGKSEIINDTSIDKRYIVDDKIRLSEISVPIIANNEVIGVIDSEHSTRNYFTTYHLKTLETIANLASSQLKNALNLQLRIETDKKNKALLKNLTSRNKELKDFAHVVSHDLKSPLRSINALANWIKEENTIHPNKIIDENTKLLLKKVDKMEYLINGILKYTSIDQVNSKKQKTDLNGLVKDIIDTIYVPKNFTVNILNKLPKLNVEKFRVYQLFQNLISNAVKYNDKQTGIINVKCKEEQSHWQFSIEDNGIGISDKYHKKIFEIFQTLENNENSTGVGLSIVKKIIDICEGKIWLTSKVNEGTIFYFTLPK
ncbi:PAS domain S-box-containing protein [Tenacibaculum sp. MAR_2010_89]|uniref:PAS domain S-box protein n=1 Tax=Tenacibaculum sp. MAR_2010_89 TaxID=1250198 RepID=UPI000897533E|nr:PAS domain S-box protein [Tenacibaculum sp. MAR_2010_89]SEE09831.1 PAS domain S-box-containing protein [Tenacibaculum sp. MAR_2010_89]